MRLGHLVMVVPGIAGSRLAAPGGPRWNVNAAQIAATLADPARLSLSEHPDLVPVGAAPAGVMPWLGVVHSLGRLTANIENGFEGVRVDPGDSPGRRDLAADVVVFPYDFRRSIEHAAQRLDAEVTARLADLSASARRDRVIVVAHSMGGLVARYWLGPLGGWEVCRALVTLGTPHRGAPKALDWLVNCPRVGGFAVPGAAEVLGGWPSAFELLPRYPVVLDSATGQPLYPYQLPLPGFAGKATAAFQTHLEIEREWAAIPSGRAPEVVPVFARGHATHGRAVWDGAQVTVSKQDAEWLPNAGWAGDATVPAIAAIPIELDGRRSAWRAVGSRHLRLPSTGVVVETLREFSGESLGPVREGDSPHRPWLGLDLDELVPAGCPVPVRAVLHRAEADEQTAAWVRIRPTGDGAAWTRYPLSAGADGWAGLLPAMEPGLYEVGVEAVNVPRWDAVRCEDVVGVVAT
ncbi:lipase/acyltransferase domain-containing protein [Frankia sp. Cas3]|uniref:PGAP1-like alpha/beta domain-containing protein n=1 Tax=Frankia sp. Cas3 TaxID=3073926 RepID=UPI002AD241B7|nr:hypothetical protein [Frankia sp. Cas3]